MYTCIHTQSHQGGKNNYFSGCPSNLKHLICLTYFCSDAVQLTRKQLCFHGVRFVPYPRKIWIVTNVTTTSLQIFWFLKRTKPKKHRSFALDPNVASRTRHLSAIPHHAIVCQEGDAHWEHCAKVSAPFETTSPILSSAGPLTEKVYFKYHFVV